MCEDDGWATGWEVMTAVRRSQHRTEVFMDESLEPLAMSFAQYRALESIVANKEIHLSELARLLRLSRQAVQTSVHKLERSDLVDLIHEPAASTSRSRRSASDAWSCAGSSPTI